MTTIRDVADRIVREDEKAFEKYSKRPSFRAWAYEGVPGENRRVAIVKEKDYPGLKWVDLYVERGDVKEFRQSGGNFYDTGDPNDHPEGALEWARSSAQAYVDKQKGYLNTPPLPPGTKRG